MIDGPHIAGFSRVTSRSILSIALASARLASSSTAAMNSTTEALFLCVLTGRLLGWLLRGGFLGHGRSSRLARLTLPSRARERKSPAAASLIRRSEGHRPRLKSSSSAVLPLTRSILHVV